MIKTYEPNIDQQEDQANLMDRNTDVADYQCIDVKEEGDTNYVTSRDVESEENGENNLLIYGYSILTFGQMVLLAMMVFYGIPFGGYHAAIYVYLTVSLGFYIALLTYHYVDPNTLYSYRDMLSYVMYAMIILLMVCAYEYRPVNSIVEFTDEDGDTQILTFHHNSKKWDWRQIPSLEHKAERKGVEDTSDGGHIHYKEFFHENLTLEYEASIGFIWYTVDETFYSTVSVNQRDQVMKTIQTLDPKKHSFISTDEKEVTLTFDKNKIIWNAYIDGNPIEMKPMSYKIAKDTLKMPEDLLPETKLTGFLIRVEQVAVREKYSWFRNCNKYNQVVYLKVKTKINAKADIDTVLKTKECKFENYNISNHTHADVKVTRPDGKDYVINFIKFDYVQEITKQEYINAKRRLQTP
jgi:hypothetical protein